MFTLKVFFHVFFERELSRQRHIAQTFFRLG